MTEASPRRGAPRRRRRPRRPAPPDRIAPLDHRRLTTVTTLPPVEPPTGFAELGVPPRIDDGLAAAGFAQPFKIQTAAIPVAMQGRDVCGRARTGSGKTLAFGVPMLARILDEAEPARPLGLVLVPTRELAVQVAEVLEPVADHAGQRILAVYGGASRHHQIDELQRGRRDRRRHAAAADRPAEVGRGLARRRRRRRARRGRPDGRRRVHAAGRVDPAPLHRAHPDDAVLGDARRRRRPPRSATTCSDPVEVAIDAATDTVGTMHHLFLAVHHMDKDRVVGGDRPGHAQGRRVLPDEAAVRQGRRGR